MSEERLENKMDEMLEKMGGLSADVTSIKKQMVPNGKKRMDKAEQAIEINSRFRHIATAAGSTIGAIIGWIGSNLHLGGQ